nr:hypothetical protein [uncultured Ruminococcus sp.]
MAFKDANGWITIDEVAAQRDIRFLNESVAYLESVLSDLNEILAQADTLRGNTGSQITAACETLKTNVFGIISKTNETVDLIQTTVNKYEAIDASIKQTIVNSLE